MEYVVTVNLQYQVAFDESMRKRSVPYQVVCVQRAVAHSTAALHGDVCGELQFQRKHIFENESIVAVKDVGGLYT
jgi:hypothetical protein